MEPVPPRDPQRADRRGLEGSSCSNTWQAFRDSLVPATRRTARDALADRFSSAVTERFELARTVGARGRDEPLHRVVPYKEAFSPQLVRAILDHLGVTEGTL